MRFNRALLPVGMPQVSNPIIDTMVALISPGKVASHALWARVVAEFGRLDPALGGFGKIEPLDRVGAIEAAAR